MADEKTVYKLDLDILGFTEKALKAKGSVESIGDAKNLEGLVKGLGTAGLALGAVGAAMLAVKATMDAVFEAEDIKAINQQFELLTKNAGLAGDALKEGLVDASKGLIDDTELMKMANKAIIEMGSSANKLPEVMELARKASAAFGTDLATNFDHLNHAIATGSTRQLRQMGIIIDSHKAMQEYARAVGTTVDSLSQAEKQQAILNAVLKKGGEAFKGVSGDTKEAQNTYQQIIVTLKEMGEIIVLVFDKIFGDAVRKALKITREMLSDTKKLMLVAFGSDAEKATAKIEGLTNQIGFWGKEITRLQELQQKDVRFKSVEKQAELTASMDSYAEKIKKAQTEIDKLKEKESGRTPATAAGPVGPAEDNEKRKAAELKFNQDLLALRQQRLQSEMQTVDKLSDYERMHQEQIVLLHEETKNKIAEIHLQRQQGHIATAQQESEMIKQIQDADVAKVREIEDEKRREQDRTLDRYVEHSTNAVQGVTRAFEAGAAKNRAALSDFGKMGQQTFDSFEHHATDAFLKVGEGSMSVAQAMKATFLNVVADQAQAIGARMMLEGIFPPNPIQLGAGAGLIALAGYLRSQAGGGKGAGGGLNTGGASGGGGSAGGAESVGFGTRTDEGSAVRQDAAPKKTVTVQVQGHYFETEQTKQRMLEMIRESTDATDFKYVQVGQK